LSNPSPCAFIANSEYTQRINRLPANCNMVAFELGEDYATRAFLSALF